ncbi:uncharacterized protein LOC120780827 [Bactrocera tryoni]|uniref:uncharacterized protein LOC120780827 n=1 Tax=Bactrocera tryoni TaxID=59916 RepID=UPI001A95D6AD|nr:uncharacterized protein LOC120780827 [Bactrocera tryoni]
MILCDYKMSIRYVDARHAGANHDSFVFNVSDLKVHLQNNIQNNTWILGDAGYPLHKFLMTPYRLAEASSPKARYNQYTQRPGIFKSGQLVYSRLESPEEIPSTSNTTMTNDVLDIEREEEDTARIIRYNIMTSL